MDVKKKICLEYAFNTSVKLLYDRISTSSGLSNWFSDDVNIEGDVYIFYWKKNEQRAKLLFAKKEKLVKFKWIDDEDEESYFEFKIINQELTSEVALFITDFVYEDDENDAIDLWNKQMDKLKRALGA